MLNDFQKILDSLPANQRQVFIDHFVKSILGKPVSSLIMPKTLTILNDGSPEERLYLFASNFNVHPESVDMAEFMQGQNEVRESKIAVMAMIKEYYENPTIDASKKNELIDLCKFLITTEHQFKFTLSEEPDFILQNDTLLVGLEHTTLQATKDKAFISAIQKKYIASVKKIMLERQPDLNGVVNLTLNFDVPVFDNKTLKDFKAKAIKDKTSFINEVIADYLLAGINGISKEKPSIIKISSFQKGKKQLTVRHNEEYFVRTDFEVMLKGYKKRMSD